MNIEQNIWGFTAEGEAAVLYTMTNSSGAAVRVTNIGAALVSVIVPDKDGNMADVVLGYDTFENYIIDGACMGKTPGRFANRIGNARFTLEGKEYRLSPNNGPNQLHGGRKGFDAYLWNSRVETDRVVFSLVSPDGDEKYPGELTVEVVYDWSEDNELEITYYAKSSATTVINLTNHAYFNLKGEAKRGQSALKQELKLNASTYLETDKGQVPTGNFIPVKGTPMDFTTSKVIGSDIDADYEALKIGNGYDHCWVIDNWHRGQMSDVGVMYDPQSGRRMTIRSTQPGVQMYTGNSLQGATTGKGGKEYDNRDGVALECQAFPDSPNKPQFPSTTLHSNEIYKESIEFKFDVI